MAKKVTQLPSPPESREQTPEEPDIVIEPAEEAATPPPAEAKNKKKRKAAGKSTKSNKKAKSAEGPMLHGRRKKGSSRVDVMSSVPSVKKLANFKSFPSFKAEMDDKNTIEFRKDQAVYVLADPESMDDPNKFPEQADYWLAIIKDIRAKSKMQKGPNDEVEWVADPSDVFVIVEWFYKPQDVVDTPGRISPKTVDIVRNAYEYMGMKEVIRSHEEAVISVFSCCDPVPIYFFDDAAGPDEQPIHLINESQALTRGKEHVEPEDPEDFPNEHHAAQENFFYRMTLPNYNASRPKAAKTGKKGRTSKNSQKDDVDELSSDGQFGLNLHCNCEEPYSPSDEVQRYCMDCPKWYHERCLAVAAGAEIEVPTPEGADAAPLALVELATMPIIRGSEWGIGGNINVVYQARELMAKGEFADWDGQIEGLQEWNDWTEMMAKLKPASNADWGKQTSKYYTCPTCSKII